MKEKQQVISKGPYTYPQVNKFLTVKQYIFYRKEGQKCLILKFMNDTGFFINEIRFKLIQLNSEGKTICSQNVLYDSIAVAPRTAFTPTSRIVVDEKCSDFKIVFDYVDSGDFRYRIKRGKIVAFYKEPKYRDVISAPVMISSSTVCVRSNRIKNRATVMWIAVIVGIAVTFMTILSCVFDLIKDQNRKDAAHVEQTQNEILLSFEDDFLCKKYFGVDNA